MNIQDPDFSQPLTIYKSNSIANCKNPWKSYNQLIYPPIIEEPQISVIQILQDEKQQTSSICCVDSIQQQIPDIIFIQFQNNTQKSTRNNFIRSALKKISKNRKNKRKNKSCGICLNQMGEDNCKLQCKHAFCRDCLLQWFQYSFKCPYCRKQSDYYCCGKQIKKTNRPIVIEDNEQIVENTQQVQQLNQFCYICNIQQPNCLLIVCNRCGQRACHPSCDQNFDQIISRDFRWYCNFCR